MLVAVKKGLGLGVLPCYIADPEPDLCQVHLPIPELEKDLWVLTHDDLRHVERVRTFIDFMASALAPQRELLEGQVGNLLDWVSGVEVNAVEVSHPSNKKK